MYYNLIIQQKILIFLELVYFFIVLKINIIVHIDNKKFNKILILKIFLNQKKKNK